MFSKVLLVIPARYGSKRLPGKPLKKIGKSNSGITHEIYSPYGVQKF